MIQKIEEVERPEIGKYYNVPVIQSKRFYYWGEQLLPVRLPKHEDKELSPEIGPHYHIDFRFVSTRLFDLMVASRGLSPASYVTAMVVCVYENFGKADQEKVIIGGPKIRQRMMKRTDIEFPYVESFHQTVFANGKTFEEYYNGKQLIDGHTCPHKGYNMKQVEPNRFGQLICPCHGLAFGAKTKTCEPRKNHLSN